MIVGWRCAVCGATVGVDEPLPFQCPNRTAADRHHVLHLVTAGIEPPPTDDANSLVRYGDRLAWQTFAIGNGLPDTTVRELIALVAPDAFVTPFLMSDTLSERVGAEVWVKDETHNVGGSHKARHLEGVLLHLLAAERLGMLPGRPPLAIASCGNAALAAATLAARVDWPLHVFVPTWMDDSFGRRLDALGAHVHRSERRSSDEPGDPALHRFREAVADGAVPFTVQGPENALCLDSGRTIGWEISDQAAAASVRLDRMFVQVGGGAFASCLGAGLGASVRLHPVQAAGCAPFASAWERAATFDRPAEHWSTVMQPWSEPASAADGILDDETYDWIALAAETSASGGHPLVAAEHLIVEAHELAVAAGFDVSVTGSAGLAGVLAAPASLAPGERIAVVMSGVGRADPPGA